MTTGTSDAISVADAGGERRIHPTVRLNFLVRVATFPFFLVVYLLHLYPRGLSLGVGALLLSHMLVYPHLARFVASRSRDTKAAELRNLLFDSFLIGVYVPLTGYSLWPNAAGFVAFHAGNLAVGGPKFTLRGLVAFMFGIGLAALVTRNPVDLQGASLLTETVSIGVVIAYISVFCIHSHRQSQRVYRSNRQIRAQSAQIEEKGRQLELARDAAESANSAKSNFLANMSHELRTPLNAIIGYSEMLIEEAEDNAATTMVPDLEKIRGSGKHLLGLINDVLDLSKIEAGKLQLYLEEFDVREILGIAASTVEPLARKNGSTLTVHASPDLGTMHADLTRIRQVLLNLLSNACKFTEHGHITLSAAREDTPRGDRIIFTVTDTGIGMTPAQVARLFHPFTQADASTTRKYGGTGLGLTITKHFVEMMGGSVRVDSAPGQGTIFTVRLPAEVGEQAAIDESFTTRRLTQSFRIPLPVEIRAGIVLVIDDDAETRQVVQRSLEREGFIVDGAAGASEGLRKARDLRPDAIALVGPVPPQNGWSLIAALKADADLSNVPVVMLNGPHDGPLADALGAAAYLSRPLDREMLLSTLRAETGAATPSNGQHVLVLEEDAMAREVLVRTLGKQGYAVSEASGREEALACLDAVAPALVMLDLVGARTDGFAFIEALRVHPRWSGLPVVIVAGRDIDDAQRAQFRAVAEAMEKKRPARNSVRAFLSFSDEEGIV